MNFDNENLNDELIEFYCFKLHKTTIESELDSFCKVTEGQDIYTLKSENNIPTLVSDFFLQTDAKFSKELESYFQKKYSFFKDEKINILPFSLKMFGAYFNRSYVFRLLLNCKNGVNGNKLKLNNKEINSFSDFEPFLIKYSEGFNYGYEKFIDEYVSQNLLIDNKNERLDKIFDFITKESVFSTITGYNNSTTFYDGNIFIGNAYIEGKFFGFVYKAWSLIFSNFNLFNEKFETHLKPKNSLFNIKIERQLQPTNNSFVNKKINNGIDIIDVLIIQLDAIIKLFKQDIKAKESKFIYYIHEEEVTFLDDKLLKQYLAKTKVENLAFLQEVLKKVDLIIKFYKIDLDSIPIKEFEFEQYYETKKSKYDIITFQDFYILVLCNDKAVTINNELLKIDFFKETDYTVHSHVSIYCCCKTIRELIITAYPKLDNKIEVDKPLNKTEITTNKNNSKENSNNQLNEINSIHPELHPNFWNNECYELFKYLFDNYYDDDKKHKRKLTNIWFFLKEDKNEKYLFDITQEQYIDFIKTNYNVQITNFVKAEFKYKEKEVIKYNEHRINFEKEYKKS